MCENHWPNLLWMSKRIDNWDGPHIHMATWSITETLRKRWGFKTSLSYKKSRLGSGSRSSKWCQPGTIWHAWEQPKRPNISACWAHRADPLAATRHHLQTRVFDHKGTIVNCVPTLRLRSNAIQLWEATPSRCMVYGLRVYSLPLLCIVFLSFKNIIKQMKN